MKAISAVIIFSFFVLFSTFSSFSFAVETAPRISDREIVESLATLKEGQKALTQGINQVEKGLDQRIDQVEKGLNRRFDDLKWFLGTMIGILMLINGAVLGYVLKRQGSLEKSLETLKDEITFLKSILEKLLPPKGAL